MGAAPLRRRAGGPQLGQPGRARRGGRHRAVLDAARRRRLPTGRDQLHLQGAGPPRRSPVHRKAVGVRRRGALLLRPTAARVPAGPPARRVHQARAAGLDPPPSAGRRHPRRAPAPRHDRGDGGRDPRHRHGAGPAAERLRPRRAGPDLQLRRARQPGPRPVGHLPLPPLLPQAVLPGLPLPPVAQRLDRGVPGQPRQPTHAQQVRDGPGEGPGGAHRDREDAGHHPAHDARHAVPVPGPGTGRDQPVVHRRRPTARRRVDQPARRPPRAWHDV